MSQRGDLGLGDLLPNWRTIVPRTASAWVLVAANLVPIIGILALDWSLLSVVVLYWAESGVIGVFNIARMIRISLGMGAALGLFFAVHFGIFMFVHAGFIMMLFHPESPFRGMWGLEGGDASVLRAGFGPMGMTGLLEELAINWWALLVLVVSHGYSFKRNFLDGREYLTMTVGTQMAAPYKRIAVMQLTLLVGGWIMVLTKAPLLIVVLLVVLKLAADLHAHQVEHMETDTGTAPRGRG